MVLLLGWALANWRIALCGALVLLVAVFLVVGREQMISKGEQIELKKVEDANHVAEQNADRGGKTVEDCTAVGGTWVRDSGVCLPAAGH